MEPKMGAEAKPPNHGLKLKLDHVYPENRSQDYTPSFKVIWSIFPLILRYIWYYINAKLKGKSIVMDYIKTQRSKQMYGVPLGGIGSGTIGRGFKGEFCRFQLRPGQYEWNTVEANQFIVTIKDELQNTIFQSLLSTYKRKTLKAWKNQLDPSKCSYTGLYPRAWTNYDLTQYGINLTCRQISPVIPKDYKNSCLPASAFIWTVENTCDEPRTVTIAFTFKNGTGSKSDRKATCSSKAFSYISSQGVILHNTIDKMNCSYALAIKSNDNITVSRCLYFDPSSSGKEIWDQLSTGKFSKEQERCKGQIIGEYGVAIAAQLKVEANTSQQIEMSLVWDMPTIQFPQKTKKFSKYYTKMFGGENLALKITDYTLTNYQNWDKAIYEWQKEVIEDITLPDWYKSNLFNQTYFVSDGGSIWLALEDEELEKLSKTDPRRKVGRFGYLEGHEYRMYNSYDVHFYASHALFKNWPLLQQALHYDLKDFIDVELKEKVKMLYDGDKVERKVKETVPHDAGDPGEQPFDLINSYPIHDVSNWRDLGSKFILQTYRDSLSNGSIDVDFIKDMYDSCCVIVDKMNAYDQDNDGLIENSGTPDQTFDTWVMEGASAYCGGLWLGALYAMTQMAKALQKPEQAKFSNQLDKAKAAFLEKLWNGSYFNFDCSQKESSSIMADQLCAQWYLRCCNEEYPIISKDCVRKTLRTIYENNVEKFCNGEMGAVNGIVKGEVDKFTIQSLEVWTGVTYALAATLIQEGFVKEGFKTAGGMTCSMVDKFGLSFDIPEALYAEKYYRAIGYMRPLSIWSMQIALEQIKRKEG